jgi:hypothetical protein
MVVRIANLTVTLVDFEIGPAALGICATFIGVVVTLGVAIVPPKYPSR